MNILEYIEVLDKDGISVHIDNNLDEETGYYKNALLVTPELNRTGAPVVLLDLARILKEEGYGIVILSAYEGDLLEEALLVADAVIYYQNFVGDDEWIAKLVGIFDFYLANTRICQPFVAKIAPLVNDIVWWIHESEACFQSYIQDNVVPGYESVHVWGASPLTKRLIKKYMKHDSEVLNFWVQDAGQNNHRNKSDLVKFLQVGTIDFNKGQNVLTEAIEAMDEEMLLCGWFAEVP